MGLTYSWYIRNAENAKEKKKKKKKTGIKRINRFKKRRWRRKVPDFLVEDENGREMKECGGWYAKQSTVPEVHHQMGCCRMWECLYCIWVKNYIQYRHTECLVRYPDGLRFVYFLVMQGCLPWLTVVRTTEFLKHVKINRPPKRTYVYKTRWRARCFFFWSEKDSFYYFRNIIIDLRVRRLPWRPDLFRCSIATICL